MTACEVPAAGRVPGSFKSGRVETPIVNVPVLLSYLPNAEMKHVQKQLGLVRSVPWEVASVPLEVVPNPL